MDAIACDSFAEAMIMVEQDEAALAMIPLENSTAGRVEEIYRLMPKTQLHIVGEHFEPVNHCLLGLQGASKNELTSVASHPQALAQCQQNLQKLGLESTSFYDTAGAARWLSTCDDPSQGAIASSLAAELYGLKVLQENFQDVTGNTTRFLILSKKAGLPAYLKGTTYITSLMFTVRNIPAALYKALGGFATNGINMVKLESYLGSGVPKDSSFHLDIEGHPDERLMQFAMQELAFFTQELRVLGTYEAHPYRASNRPLPE
jgi:prephenate dehydratase